MKLILIIFIALAPLVSFAKTKAKLGTDFKFDPHSVRGNYKYSDHAEARVENEKSLNPILQPRKQFKDRLKNEMTLKQARDNKKTEER